MTHLPGLDLEGLAGWLTQNRPDLADGALTATRLAGGRSNLTYRVDGASRPLVLRRPPLGPVLASAHDMRREHQVMSALHRTAVPVPVMVDLVDDTGPARVTGTVFQLMELVEGRVIARPQDNAGFTAEGLRRVSLALAETLADLHTLDPGAVGLAGFGRAEGYLARQLTTWHRQLGASRSRPLPRLDRLAEWLGRSAPASSGAALLHGDYRLDNLLVSGSGAAARISAVLDWEMSTLGDPLADLGTLGLYWTIGSLPGVTAMAPSAVDPAAGYPGFPELVARYTARLGRSVPDLTWYRAFAAYKLAVIAEGIHHRWQLGGTVGAGFDGIGTFVEPLAAEGLRHAGLASSPTHQSTRGR